MDMDVQQTKFYLDKLNREFNRLAKDPDTINSMDVALLKSYVIHLYDSLLSESIQTTDERQVPREPETKSVSLRPSTGITPILVETPKIIQEPEPGPPTKPTLPVEESPKSPAPGVPVRDAQQLFEEKQAKELSDKLADMPIADLRKAIALNDRLLLTKELFSSDAHAFDHTIQAINNLANFEEAQSFLLANCVGRFEWLDKKRIETAKSFIRLVRRRFK
jgi:hypothetical protein